MKTKKKTIDALAIMDGRFYRTRKERVALEEARVNAEAARLIYDMRTQAKLSQKELAVLIGTTQSVISRLEDDDYDGHSLSMLSRITAVLNKHLVLKTIEA